jgi:hypothetical protein
MANISREEEEKIKEWQKRTGGGRRFPSTHRADAYNAVHGTYIRDDEMLDRVLENEAKPKRLLGH